ncbi:MAG: DNA gyrase subunit A [Chloroflexi bacterium]|nr:DNA gyrase subunit A [Chloroflexota bacterium]
MVESNNININQEMRESYLDYAMSVIVARALPDARDGLKPVHRRILFAMHDMGIRPGTPFKKSARIVGEVLGKFHPHSDDAVYDAMARMAQEFSLRYELVEGQGNFGSLDGDRPAAMRYTEARLSSISAELLADIQKETVDFGENYDGSMEEPFVLPARLPNLLLNGTSGIAVGMSTNIPPHNLSEICHAITHLIDHYDSRDDITVTDLLEFVRGPDFPTGGNILVDDGLRDAYQLGRGGIIIRSTAEIVTGPDDRFRIIFSDIPYQVNKSSVIERIVELARGGQIKGISDLRDESDREGLRLVVDLETRAQPSKVLNRLYKYTQLQTRFNVQLLALDQGEPKTLNLKRCLLIYIQHRLEVIRRRSEFDLSHFKDRAHVLAGLLRILEELDDAIRIIRAAQDTPQATMQLCDRFQLSERQAEAVLALRLRRLVALEQLKLADEYQQTRQSIQELEGILASETKRLALIRAEVKELVETYGDERRTQLLVGESIDFDEADLVRNEPVVILLTIFGYIKRVPQWVFRSQLRGGKGVFGVATKQDDLPALACSAISLDTLLFFTNQGRVYAERTFRIPEKGRTSRGVPIQSVLPLREDEKITAMIPFDPEALQGFFVMATRFGYIKRVPIQAFSNVRPSGLIAITLQEGDELGWVRISDGSQELIVASDDRMSIRFTEEQVSITGRTARGVRAMRLAETSQIVGVDLIRDTSDYVLIVTDLGYGKITRMDRYRAQSRNGVGIRTFANNEERGDIIAMHVIRVSDEILLMSRNGTILRTNVQQINPTGRLTQGVKIMNLLEGDRVVAVTVLETVELKPGELAEPASQQN